MYINSVQKNEERQLVDSGTIIAISWLILAGATFMGELMIPQFFLFWFGLGAIAALVSHIFGVAYVYQWAIFAVISGVGLFSTRLFAKAVLKGEPKKSVVYELLGKEMKVTRTVENIKGTGQVQVGGEIWRAISEDGSIIEVGTRVRVNRIEGVSLIVNRVDGKTT